MGTVVDVLARLRADASSMIRGFKDADAAARRMRDGVKESADGSGRAFDGLKARTVALGSALGTLAARGIEAAIRGAKNLAVAGIKAAADYEQSQIAFETMLGSAQAADAFLGDLRDFAEATPFELPQLLVGARRLMAMGFAAQDIKPMLTAVGDAASGLGIGSEGIDRITRALGQMRARGKVSGDELLQLSEAGVPALQYLADALGKTTGETQKMIEKGLIPADQGVQMIVAGLRDGTANARGFGGMMAKQATTLSGVWSTFKDTVSNALIDSITPHIPKITGALQAVIPHVGTFMSTFVNGAIDVGTRLADLGRSAWEHLQPIVDLARGAIEVLTTGNFNGGLFAALGIEEDSGFVGALFDARDGVLALIDAFKNGDITSDGFVGAMETIGVAARAVWDWFRDSALPVLEDLGATAVDVAAWLGPALVDAFVAVVDAGRDAVEFYTEHEDAIKKVATVIGVLLIPHLVRVGALAVVSAAKQAAAWLLVQTAGTRAAIASLVTTYKIIGGWVLMGAAALRSGAQTAVIWAMYQAGAVKAAAAHVASGARIVAGWALMGAQAALHAARVVAGWVLMGTQSLLQAARMAAAWVIAMGPVGWVIAAVVGLVALIIANWDTVKEWTKKAWDWVVDKIKAAWTGIKDAVGGAVDWVRDRVQAGLDFYKRIWEAAWTWVKDKALDLWKAIKDAVGGAVDWVKDKIDLGLATIKEIWRRSWDWVKEKVDLVWTGITTAIDSARRTVVDFFLDMVGRVLEGADKMLGWVPGLGPKLDEAKQAFQAFRDGVNTAMGGINNKSVSLDVAWGPGATKMATFKAQALAKGGGVFGPGTETSDSIPAMLSKGEHVWTAKEVKAAGGHGAVEALRRGVLKRARGGPVEFNVGARTPRTDEFAAGTGRYDAHLDRSLRALVDAEKKRLYTAMDYAGIRGGGAGGSASKLVQFGRLLQSMGYRVAEHPAFGGVSPVHAPNSRHYSGRAIDVNWAAGTSAAEQRMLAKIVPVGHSYGLRSIFMTKGHYGHAHFDYDQGGLARGVGYLRKNTLRPERVLPPKMTATFDRFVAGLPDLMGGAGVTYVDSREIHIHMPPGSDGEDVVRAIQRYEKRNGSDWRKGG
ncbi:MAG: tape measure protein [Actinomycetota bacterium]